VVASQRLHTWEISGPGLQAVTASLRKTPGAELVASFGATLHVSGRDRATLQAGLASRLADTQLTMKPIAPSLEDAFIHLMQSSRQPAND